MTEKIRREGLTVLRESADDAIDLVFVHGLNGHPLDTWTQNGRNDTFCWIKSLPDSFRARAMTFGYIAEFEEGGDNLMGLRQHATSLLRHLKNKRTSYFGRRPLVFICHSLGGLITKQAIILSAKKPEYGAIYSSTKAIFFFGTPHRGARSLDSKKRVAFVERLAKITNNRIPPNLRAVLEPASNELFGVNDDFPDMKKDMIIVNFHEARKTPSISALVVERESAMVEYPGAENIALMRTHQELVRFPDSEDDTFIFISETLADKLSGLLKTQALEEVENITSIRSDYVKRIQFNEASRRLEQISIPHRKTFSWLWDEGTGVRRWLEASNSLLLITGKPGSGKSVLMKEIHSQLERKCAHETIILPFFFNGRGTDLQKSVEGMLRAFVAGILQQASDVQNAILRAYRMKTSASEFEDEIWEKNDLMRVLLDLLSPRQSRMSIILLVDALDECLDESSTNLFKYLKGLTELGKSNVTVTVCVSSRDLPMSLDHDSKSYSLCLHDWTKNDIENYVEDKLTDLVPEAERRVLNEMKEKIIQKADGIFLWVELTLEQLQQAVVNGGTPAKYQQLLSYLPARLTDLYCEILNRIPADFHTERDDLLRIVLCSFRPLKIPEMRLALALNENEFASHAAIEESPDYLRENSVISRIIKSRCGGLLETKNDGKAANVQFIHQSVKELLDNGGGTIQKSWKDSLSSGGHEFLAKACLRYCSLPELRTLRDNLHRLNISGQLTKMDEYWELYPLGKYAVTSWMRHCSEAERLGFPQTAELKRFREAEDETFEVWTDLYRFLTRGRLPGDMTLFHIGTYYNLVELTRTIMSTSTETTLSHESKEHGLQIAAAQRHKDLVKLFIDDGVDVNATGGTFYTPLFAAAFSGDKEIVRILIKAGADASLGESEGNSPLSAAAWQGDDEIVQILLAHGANQSSVLNEALSYAALFGNGNIVRRLLDAGADPSAWERGMNVLFWGMVSSSPETAKILVEHGADTSVRVFSGLTVLHWMCLHGNEHVVKILLELGAEPNCVDRNGATPLHFAASNWQPKVIDVLLGAEADPNISNNQGITPLHLACARSGISQVEALIHAEADFQIHDNSGMNIVHFAALNGSADVLGSLLKSQEELEIDVKAVDLFGRSPIHLAAEFGCRTSLKILARDKEELTKRDKDGRTAAHAAARNNPQVLQQCLQAGADPLARDDGDRTVLHHIFSKPTQLSRLDLLMDVMMKLMESAKEVRSSIKKRRDIEEIDNSTAPSENEAAKFVVEKIDLLLEHGVDINAQDYYGNTALHLACWANDIAAIEHLIKRDAKTTLRNSDGILPEMVARADEARKLFLSIC